MTEHIQQGFLFVFVYLSYYIFQFCNFHLVVFYTYYFFAEIS